MKVKVHLFLLGFIVVLSVVVIASFTNVALSQDTVITPEQAANYIGKVKTVCGKVVSVHYAYSSRGRPTFLNLSKPYPKQIFTVVI